MPAGTFGTTTIATGGRGVRASANRIGFRPKAGGITVDWATVTAVSGADVTLADGTIVKIGDKYLRYGQVMTRITATGKFGPYASGAVDGRQLMVRGDAFILDQTCVLSRDLHADHPSELFDGGMVYLNRMTDVAGAPTRTQLETLFPAVTWVLD